MPKVINNQTNQNEVTIKFFDKVLTGNGKARGLINENKNDLRKNLKLELQNIVFSRAKKIVTNIERKPELRISYDANNRPNIVGAMFNVDTKRFKRLKTKSNPKVDTPMFARISIEKLYYYDPQVKDVPKSLAPKFSLDILYKKNNDKKYETVVIDASNLTPNGIAVVNDFLNKPDRNVQLSITDLDIMQLAYELENNGLFDIDLDPIIDSFNMYDILLDHADKWINLSKETKENIDAYILKEKERIDNIVKFINDVASNHPSLEVYQAIYESLVNHIDKKNIKEIMDTNLHLMLFYNINTIKLHKHTLPTIPNVANPDVKRFSNEQQKAILTTEPLAIVQASAGSGKSTVILERVDHMIKAGIKPEEIIVLSFTNIAADNIKAKNPNILSMTTASMIHSIYSENFKHELSNEGTLENALSLYLETKSLSKSERETIEEFKRAVNRMKIGKKSAYDELNNIIRTNYERIISLLDELNQTTLAIEIIIAHHKKSGLKLPSEFENIKHVIVDETQDNSVFEFVYLLEFTAFNNNSLFIVGDCSQTLYEFRAANPLALNAIEASNVFAAYKLSTNYRSNDAILRYANSLLENIDANKFAKIKMSSNKIGVLDKKTFKDAIHIRKFSVSKEAELEVALEKTIPEIAAFISTKLKNNEQVAILAPKRSTVYFLGDILKTIFKDKNVYNLVSQRFSPVTFCTEFLNESNTYSHRATSKSEIIDELKRNPQKSALEIIIRCLINNKDKFIKGSKKDYTKNVDKYLKYVEMLKDKASPLANVAASRRRKGQIIESEEFEIVQNAMIEFEIVLNKMLQSNIQRLNSERKLQAEKNKPDIIISTIHGVKGLEFDNTVILMRDRDQTEEEKRMYYVALTRAKLSELILIYNKQRDSVAVQRYEEIVESLPTI